MRFVQRAIGPTLLEASRNSPSVVVTGPGRTGKTSLLRSLLPRARYVLLQDPDLRDRISRNPRALVDELKPPVVFDEIQNVPELFAYIGTQIDENPSATEKWFFYGVTGSSARA